MQKLAYAGHMGSHAISSFAKGHQRGQAFGASVVKGATYLDTGMQGLHLHGMLAEAQQITPMVPGFAQRAGDRYWTASQAATRPTRHGTAAEAHRAAVEPQRQMADAIRQRRGETRPLAAPAGPGPAPRVTIEERQRAARRQTGRERLIRARGEVDEMMARDRTRSDVRALQARFPHARRVGIRID